MPSLRGLRALTSSGYLLVAAAAACSGPKADATKSVREAIVTLSAEGDAAGLTTALFATAGLRIVVAGDGAKLSFLPRGCLTTTHDVAARTISYAFANCTYLRAIRVNGTLAMTYEESANGYDITLRSPKLRLGSTMSSLTGTAKVEAIPGGRIRVSLDTELDGESKAGPFTRSVKRTVTWSLGTACFDAEGTSEGQMSGRDVSVSVGPYRRCRSQCPEPNSQVVVRDEGQTYRVTFDGTDTATLAEDGESTRTLTLACER